MHCQDLFPCHYQVSAVCTVKNSIHTISKHPLCAHCQKFKFCHRQVSAMCALLKIPLMLAPGIHKVQHWQNAWSWHPQVSNIHICTVAVTNSRIPEFTFQDKVITWLAVVTHTVYIQYYKSWPHREPSHLHWAIFFYESRYLREPIYL